MVRIHYITCNKKKESRHKKQQHFWIHFSQIYTYTQKKMLRRAAISAVASTSKRCSSGATSPSSVHLNRIHHHPLKRVRHNSGNANKTGPTNEEMPELTAFDAVGGLLKASTGGIAVFGLGAVGVIGVASFAANVSKQFIGDGDNEKKEKTKRESLLEELNELKDEEDTWGNRRRQRKIKRELKKLVDEM